MFAHNFPVMQSKGYFQSDATVLWMDKLGLCNLPYVNMPYMAVIDIGQLKVLILYIYEII